LAVHRLSGGGSYLLEPDQNKIQTEFICSQFPTQNSAFIDYPTEYE
jgi:hypothetical protein